MCSIARLHADYRSRMNLACLVDYQVYLIPFLNIVKIFYSLALGISEISYSPVH